MDKQRIAKELLRTAKELTADPNDWGRKMEYATKDWLHLIAKLLGELKAAGMKKEARELRRKIDAANKAMSEATIAAYVYGAQMEDN